MSRRERQTDDDLDADRRRQEVDRMFDLAAPSAEPSVVARLTLAGALITPELRALFDADGVVPPDELELRSTNDDDGATADVVVGRSVDLRRPFRIDCARLSTAHATFSVRRSSAGEVTVTVTDTSTNGVWINGERLRRNEARLLRDGDTVCLLKPGQANQLYIPFTFRQLVFRFAQTERQQQEEGTALAAAAVALSNGGAMTREQEEQFLSEITCSICMGVYVRPTCVIPCLHTFCAPCVRRFVAESLRAATANGGGAAAAAVVTCPDCRGPLSGYSVNHKVQALIEQVVALRPHLRRAEGDVVELDVAAVAAEEAAKKAGVASFDLSVRAANNNNSNVVVQLLGADDDSSEDDDEGGNDLEARFGAAAAGLRLAAAAAFTPLRFVFGGGGAAFAAAAAKANNAPAASCAQCKDADPLDGFVCPPGGLHLTCKCCRKVFPDRPAAAAQRGQPQRCGFCSAAFCDAFCGPCAHPAGVGALRKLDDYAVVGSGEQGSLPLSASLFKNNATEQAIFAAFMQDNALSARDVWQTCLAKFRAGEWPLDQTPGMVQTVTPATPVCMCCAERVFAALLVHYRISVRTRMPPAVAARPDCWYGLECRTQHHNQGHAERYNHVCIPRKGKE